MQWTFLTPHSAAPTSLSVVLTVPVRELRRDVGKSFRNHAAIDSQLDVDMPRMAVRIAGEDVPTGVAARKAARALCGAERAPILLALATQAGMGVPYEMLCTLMQPHHVAEPVDATRLRVDAQLDSGKVAVRSEKTLRVFRVEGGVDRTLHYVEISMLVEDLFGEGEATVIFDIA